MSCATTPACGHCSRVRLPPTRAPPVPRACSIVAHAVALLLLLTHVVAELVVAQHIEILRSGDGEYLLVRPLEGAGPGCCSAHSVCWAGANVMGVHMPRVYIVAWRGFPSFPA